MASLFSDMFNGALRAVGLRKDGPIKTGPGMPGGTSDRKEADEEVPPPAALAVLCPDPELQFRTPSDAHTHFAKIATPASKTTDHCPILIGELLSKPLPG